MTDRNLSQNNIIQNHHFHDFADDISATNATDKRNRNIWTEKKNAVLVEIVKNSPFPSPWRPKHGTSKEVWTEITNQLMSRTDIFDKPIHWESAKEHLNILIDRQKMRRQLGDFEVKSQTEKYLDDMIKHIIADDAEKASQVLRQKERNMMSLPNRVSRSTMENAVMAADERKRKLEQIENDSILQLNNNVEMEEHLNSISVSNVEREKMRLEYELQREKMRNERDKERDEIILQRDQEFVKFVEDQLAASRQLFQAMNEMINKVLGKLDILHKDNNNGNL